MISQGHILTYVFQGGYLMSQYGFYSNDFDLYDESKTKYKLISWDKFEVLPKLPQFCAGRLN
jgi:hypothetical protein